MNFDVNYLAVLASAIVFMIVGFLWYGPLFGKQWMRLVNMSPESMKSMPKGTRTRFMIGIFIAALIGSFVIAVLLKSLLITTFNNTVMLAFLVWLGFVATTMVHRVLFERSPIKLYFINAFQSLVAYIIGALVIVWWPW